MKARLNWGHREPVLNTPEANPLIWETTKIQQVIKWHASKWAM